MFSIIQAKLQYLIKIYSLIGDKCASVAARIFRLYPSLFKHLRYNDQNLTPILKIMPNKFKILLLLAHISIICSSNILVQYPITIFNLNSTWGAITYPVIFILTDLTTRLGNASQARRIVYYAMIPGLIGSYFISNLITYHQFFVENSVSLRIAVASFSAYVLGQLIDIFYFQKLRQKKQWWIAPTVSTVLGNLIDTYVFFFVAFYQSQNTFMSTHWLEIAAVDLTFKIIISLVTFVPLYGVVLSLFLNKRFNAIKA